MVEVLWQRLNGDQWSMFPSPRPVLMKLGLVPSRPHGNEPSCTRWQLSGDDFEALDIDGSLGLAVAGVEMGAAVMGLVVIHPDRDPVKAAYLRHPGIVKFQVSQNKTWL
jgi:hypothetical protein